MTFLVPEVHMINLPFLWFLSFFARIKAYRLHAACPHIFCTRIEVLDLDEYFTPNAHHCFRSYVMRLWERFLEKFPNGSWNLRYDGFLLDFSTKAKQELAIHFERLILLREVWRRHGPASRVYVIDSSHFKYLKSLASSSEFFKYPAAPLASQINIVLDNLFLYFSIAGRMMMMVAAIFYGCLRRDRYHSQRCTQIPFIWDAVNPSELTLDRNRRSFPWVVDGKYISPQDVLFILPRHASRKARPDLRSDNYLASTILELYRLIPIRILLGCLRELAMLVAKHALLSPRGLVAIQKADCLVRVIRLKPVIRHFRPTCYITSMSAMGSEDPSIVYMNSMGIRTVMYCYSATYCLPGDERCTCDFRAINFANVLASYLVVWHKDIQRFVQQHPQEKVRVKAIGPLMPGDESVFELPPHILRARLRITPPGKRDSLRYISLFDVAPKAGALKKSLGVYPNIYTEEYMYIFLRDMCRLLQDFDDIVLMFKPQRSLKEASFAYSNEFRQIVQGIEDHDRGYVLEDDINPWIPIAAADMCIAVPFTVPPLAGMQHGIPGLFHDPTGIARNHRYKAIAQYITHDYAQLRSKVEALCSHNPWGNGDREALWSQVREFIGERPGTNSTDSFRKFLSEIRQHRDLKSSKDVKHSIDHF